MFKFLKQSEEKSGSFLLGLSIGVASVSLIGFLIMTVAYLQKTLPDGNDSNNANNQAADNKADDKKNDNSAKNTQPTGQTAKANLKVNDNDYIRGNKNAKITIIEFSDLQCPYCARFHETIKQILAAYPNDVRLVLRHFPLNFHKYAQKASEGTECAGEQGKFWDFVDKIFANQSNLSDDYLKQAAKELNLDTGKFEQCLSSGKYSDKVKADLLLGQQSGVKGTPASFINGELLSGAQPFDAVKAKIESLK